MFTKQSIYGVYKCTGVYGTEKIKELQKVY